MPAIFGAGNQALANVRRLAAGGDHLASVIMAFMNNTYYADLVPGAEAGGGAAANSIRVAGQIRDQDGNAVLGVKNVLITSKPVSGAGTITDGGAGAVVAGSASINCWMTTDANGAFQFDVLNAAAEVNLVKVDLDNGTTEMLTLTFA
jgi:hypothetical protein